MEQRRPNDVSHVKGLISKKEDIEEEIKALLDVLKTVSVTSAQVVTIFQYGMKGVCAGHVQRTALVDGARIGAQNAILCWCNTTLDINLRVPGAHNV